MEEIKNIRVEGGIGNEICAAIAMALDSCSAGEHDSESFVITIKPHETSWSSHQRTIRKLPNKK